MRQTRTRRDSYVPGAGDELRLLADAEKIAARLDDSHESDGRESDRAIAFVAPEHRDPTASARSARNAEITGRGRR
jgi:hypothetical protein